VNLARTSLVAALVLAAALLVTTTRAGIDRGSGTDPGSFVEAPASSSASASTSVRPATGLDPGLAAAYRRARSAAAGDGHDLVINSGYRTPERQQELLDEEVRERGSYEEANRWVFTPDRSMHVQGLAIDVGDRGAAGWLRDHGATFGLCHTLSWEWWHFEWRQRWEDARSCPPEARDPAEAPAR
jgi:hypothetical protein